MKIECVSKFVIFVLTLIGCMQNAIAAPVKYSFDFLITSDMYRYSVTGPLFTKGTHGVGVATFDYQTSIADISTSYSAVPFDVSISFDGGSLKLIDSNFDYPSYGRRGIIVVNIPSSGVTYDAILFEGFSGPLLLQDGTGVSTTRSLHTQLGLFSLSNTISNSDLSFNNIYEVANSPIITSFNIMDLAGGQVNGSISNFKIQTVTPVPEPETYALLLAGLGLIGATAKRRKSKQA